MSDDRETPAGDVSPQPLAGPSATEPAPGGVLAAAPSGPAEFTSLDYEPDPRIRWGLGQFFAGFGLFLGVIVAINVAAVLLPEAASGPILLVGTIAGYGVLLLVAVRASRRLGLGSLRDDFGLRFRPHDLLLGAGAFLGVKLAVVVIFSAVGRFFPTAPSTNVSVGDGVVWIVLNTIIASTIIAPVVEELFFRGLLLRSIRNRVLRGGIGGGSSDSDSGSGTASSAARTNGPTDARRRAASLLAIVISSLVFMALHLYQAGDLATAVSLGLTTFLLGAANAWMATATGRLGAGIVAHVLNNGFAVIVVLVLLATGGSM